MKKGILISSLLNKSVLDKKNKLAGETRRVLFKTVKDAGGLISKFDVTNGQIFIELKDDKGFKELQDYVTTITEVTIEEVSPLKLVFLKSQAQAGL